MNYKTYLNKILLVFILSAITTPLLSQKIQFETIIITYSYLNIGGGSVIFQDNSTLSIGSEITVKSGSLKNYNIAISLNGRDQKGNLYAAKLEGLEYTEGGIKGKMNIRASKDNPIYINSVSVSVTDPKNRTTTDTQQIFSGNLKTSFAILLNGTNSNSYCKDADLDFVYYSQFQSSAIFGVVLGLNNTKDKEPTPLEASLSNNNISTFGNATWSKGEEVFERRINLVKDKAGNWTYSDSFKIKEGEQTPMLTKIDMFFVNKCNDTFGYTSVYKEKLNDKKKMDYKVRMNSIGTDNPIFTGGLGAQDNILALTFPNSGVSISGGSIVFSGSSSVNMRVEGSGMFASSPKTNVSVTILGTYKDREVQQEYKAVWNDKTNQLEFQTKFEASKENPFVINDFEISFVTEKLDTLILMSKDRIATSVDEKEIVVLFKRTEKRKRNPEVYEFGSSSVRITNESNLTGLYFSFALKKGSSIPASMNVNVKIKTCNNEVSYISVDLKFDAKTGLWTGYQTIVKESNCEIEVKNFKVSIVNQCDQTITASHSFPDEKSNDWKCEDECLSAKNDQVCGKTDHF